jgi:hypothetical protein
MRTSGPPSSVNHVELRPEPQKNPNLNSPKNILFVIQRKTAEFPQDKNLHLATLFSVCLRVFPFWKDSPKKSQPKNPVHLRPNDH